MVAFVGETLQLTAFFVESKVGKTGLTVTVDVYRNGVKIIDNQPATEQAGGLYSYDLAGASNNAAGRYTGIFKTATTTVDQQQVPSHFIVRSAMPNATIADAYLNAAKFVDGFLTNAKFADGAISAPKIADDALTADKFATGAISSDALAANAITAIATAILSDRAAGTTTGSPTTTSIQATGSELSSSDDVYINAFLVITSGPLKGLARKITDYAGGSKTFTTQAFPSAPGNGVTVAVVGNVPSA